jgi:hypothetical protein
MSKPRKPRSDSKLKNLPEDVQDRIVDWCRNDSLQSACSRCASELHPPIKTTIQSLSEFLSWWKLQRTFRQADQFARTAMDELRREFPDAHPEKIAAAGQLFFTMQAANTNDADLFKELEYLRVRKEEAANNARIAELKLSQKDRQLTQKDAEIALALRRVELLEKKLQDAQQALDDKSISAEEQAARIREIFKK